MPTAAISGPIAANNIFPVASAVAPSFATPPVALNEAFPSKKFAIVEVERLTLKLCAIIAKLDIIITI